MEIFKGGRGMLPFLIGTNILAANQPSRAPVTFGGVLGKGLTGGFGQYQQYQQQQLENQRAAEEAALREQQMTMQLEGLKRKQAAREKLNSLLRPSTVTEPGTGQSVTTPSSFDPYNNPEHMLAWMDAGLGTPPRMGGSGGKSVWVNVNGKPRLVSEDEAMKQGLPKWEKPGKGGSSPTLTISPDGTVTYGSGPPVFKPTGKTTMNALEGEVKDLAGQLVEMDSIADTYSKDFLTYAGRAKSLGYNILDKLDMANPEQVKFVKQRQAFVQKVESVFNAFRKDITGAAASVVELEGLKKAIINADQGPAQFEASYAEFMSKLKRAIKVKQQLIEDGIPLNGAALDKALGRTTGADGSMLNQSPGSPQAIQGIQQIGRFNVRVK